MFYISQPPEIGGRPLFKSEALFLICRYFEQTQYKYFCEIKIIFAINQFPKMYSSP